MRLESIRVHLQSFSILRKRRTTIAHAFASALAPVGVFDKAKILAALEVIGQSEGDLRCVYCDSPADTWDHLVGLVSDKRFSGFGHVPGNLVPCCKQCNSSKGNRDWVSFVFARNPKSLIAQEKVERLRQYQKTLDMPGLPYEKIRQLVPDEIALYEQIELDILRLMSEADKLAEAIRSRLAEGR